MTFSDDMTLGEARDGLRLLVDDGASCPCCRQHAQVYKRTIHSAMARDFLACFSRYTPGTWFDLTLVVGKRGTGDVTKLRYWGLLEQMPAIREDGSPRSGWWRVTPAGIAFAQDRLRVPKVARVYNGNCLGLAGPMVGIRDSLGKRFDYRELMAPQTSFELQAAA